MLNFAILKDDISSNKFHICSTHKTPQNSHIINSILHLHAHPEIETEMYQLTPNLDSQSISFNAVSVETFDEFFQSLQNDCIEYALAKHIAKTLSIQLYYLMQKLPCGEKSMFSHYCRQNMIIINKKNVFYMGSSNLVRLERVNDRAYFTEIRKHNCCSKYEDVNFLSPELINITSVPCKIQHQSIYWSLALFVSSHLIPEINILTQKEDVERKRMYSPTTIVRLLDDSNICGTPLFYFLIRCFKRHPKHRLILMI
jgi:hypothetical protein